MTASSYLQERVADFKQHIDSKQLSRSYLTEFTVNLDESMQLLQGNLRRASELIASFKQVAVDQSSEARYNFSLADNLHQVVVSLGHKLKKAQCEVDIQCDPKLSIFLPWQLHPDLFEPDPQLHQPRLRQLGQAQEDHHQGGTAG